MQQKIHIAELWTKLKTIRDDESTPAVYGRWCEQTMEFLVSIKNGQ